jgi:hypothetical protein
MATLNIAKAKCLRSLEADEEFDVPRLFNRKIGRIGCFQDSVQVPGGALAQGKFSGPVVIRHSRREISSWRCLSVRCSSGYAMAAREAAPPNGMR